LLGKSVQTVWRCCGNTTNAVSLTSTNYVGLLQQEIWHTAWKLHKCAKNL